MHKQGLFTIVLAAGICTSAQAQLDDATIRDLKGGRIENDTSYVYWLPYEQGHKYFLVQGWASKYSHKDELSLDFKMKPGTKIFAAREGIVTAVKEDAETGGLKDEYLNNGNHIVIRHADGSNGGYWHLQKEGALVNIGDTVQKGQLIGLSGNTGYSAFPHLHFYVYKNEDGFKTLPTRFITRSGIRYLRPGYFYKAVHRREVVK
jgi:hypothetical protein